jgi:hypothetical protein
MTGTGENCASSRMSSCPNRRAMMTSLYLRAAAGRLGVTDMRQEPNPHAIVWAQDGAPAGLPLERARSAARPARCGVWRLLPHSRC